MVSQKNTDMKRSFLLFIMIYVFANTFAQHIKFMGIPLGQPVEVIHNMLLKKELGMCGKNKYYGTFWKYENSDFTLNTKNGRVTSVNVNMDINRYRTIDDFNNLVKNLNSKYGNYYAERVKNDIQVKEYYWKVTGGYIMAYYFIPTFFGIQYIDSSDKTFIPPKVNKRNSNDDL